jgi:hypothetical protein
LEVLWSANNIKFMERTHDVKCIVNVRAGVTKFR